MNLKGKDINNCYRVIKKLEENNLFTTWKAEGIFSPLTFTLKFLNKKDSDYNLEEYLRFEKMILSIYKINHPNLKRIFEIEKYEGYTYVSMEYVEGESLYDYLKKKKKLPYKDALWIIIQICKGLEVATKFGALHKGLNPHHILLGIENNEINAVKISNFGFAEFDFFKRSSEGELINRFGYLPPESFGYFDWAMDERSDLYSLGAIFYKLLTGKSFVKGNSIDEIFRSFISLDSIDFPKHITKDVPPTALKIIKKLLNYKLEDRYQSTLGLLTDLERLNRGEKDFELGIEDETFNPTFETRLINRKNELAALRKLFDNAKQKRGGFCIIEGYLGSGKSKLLEESSRSIYGSGGIVLKGGFKSSDNKIPYQGFKELINSYIDFYNKLDESKKIKIRDDFSKRSTEDIAVVLKQFQALSGIINNLDKIEKVDNNKVGNKYIEIFTDFFCGLPIIDEYYVFVLDNLQYADGDSLVLLSSIMEKLKDVPLQIVATYTKLENYENPQLEIIINNDSIFKITLDNFNRDDIEELIVNVLSEKALKIPERVVDCIYEKSKGNPFYAKEAIKHLISEEVAYPVINKWEYDVKRLDEIDDLDIKDIILKRLQLLRSDELNIITIISILDVEVDLERLARTTGSFPENILSIIDGLASQKLLFKKQTYEGTKVFMHDIVKSVLLNKLYEGKIRNVNFDVAVKLEKDFIEDKIDIIKMIDETFIITDHFVTSEDIEKTIEYSIKSAMVARDLFAYREALKYFLLAKRVIESSRKEYQCHRKEVEQNISELEAII